MLAPRCLLMMGAAFALAGCPAPPSTTSPPPAPPAATPAPFPPLEGPPPDCRDHPHLCGLPLVDLGGGEAPHAFQLVFIGDGFSSTTDFAAVVDRFHTGLVRDDGGPVAFDPALFHFWRIDLTGPDASTINDDRRDTPLGAWLSPPDSCVGLPFIAVDDARVRLALAHARAPDGAPVDLVARGPVHGIVVVASSTGRANADVDVRVSSFDDTGTLRHELGHALFELADEYAEFDACPRDALIGAARATDGDLVHVANIQRSTHPAKWQGLSASSEVGGSRVPCLHHAAACLMAGTADAFCPVCRLAIEERLDLQRCGDDDVEAPRVAIDAPLDAPDLVILPGGSHAVVRAAVDDTRDGGLPITWHLDGELVAEGALATLDLVALSRLVARRGEREAFADAALVARAVDDAGNVGESRPALLDEALPGILEVQPTTIGSVDGVVGVRVESLRPFDLIDVKSAVDSVIANSGATGTVTVAIRVPLEADVTLRLSARSADGRLRGPEQTVTVPTRSTTTLAPQVAFVAGSADVPLGPRSLLFVEVASCVALRAVGVVHEDGRTRLEPLPPPRGPACVEGAPPPRTRYAVDVDDADGAIGPVVVDVTGRRTVGPALVVERDAQGADDALVVTLDRPKSPFDVATVAVAAVDDTAIVSGAAVVGARALPLVRSHDGLRGGLYPVELQPGEDRLRVAATIRRADGTLALVREEVSLQPLHAAVDVRPPLVLAPLHSPRGAGLQDVVVVDDRGLGSATIDGFAAAVSGAATVLRAPPGAVVVVVDAAGLRTTATVGRATPAPRVTRCE